VNSDVMVCSIEGDDSGLQKLAYKYTSEGSDNPFNFRLIAINNRTPPETDTCTCEHKQPFYPEV